MSIMKTKLFRFETKDNLELQELLYLLEKETKKAILHVHGIAGNFYENNYLDAMAEKLLH